MRKLFRVWFKTALCAMAVFAVFACGAKNKESAAMAIARDMAAPQAAAEIAAGSPEYKEAGGAENDGAPSETAFPQNERKLIREASIRLRVTDLAEAEKPVAAALKKYGGYAARSAVQEDSRAYTLRVPSSSYEAFLADLSPLGTVLYREESADDVTLRYYDLEGRLATKKTLLVTYQSYLGKANNIEEILSVEARVADLQAEIENLGGQFKTLADRIDYATVHLELYLPAAASQSWEPGLGERITELFGEFGGFLKSALVAIVGFILYGIPVLAAAAFAYWLLLGKVGLLRYLWRLIAKKNAAKGGQT